MLIIHAPSEVTYYYDNEVLIANKSDTFERPWGYKLAHPSRRWVRKLPYAQRPQNTTLHPMYWPRSPFHPVPGTKDRYGCDTRGFDSKEVYRKQTDRITILPEDAIIADWHQEFFNVISAKRLKNIIYTGVHLNQCLLNRAFSINHVLGWGLFPILVREVTDTMYKPNHPPYVSHERGNQLYLSYMEKFWVPTMSMWDIMRFPQVFETIAQPAEYDVSGGRLVPGRSVPAEAVIDCNATVLPMPPAACPGSPGPGMLLLLAASSQVLGVLRFVCLTWSLA
eukprot:TRINITY_DN27247_c0_g1_i1.p1 TRINITY_DN27247_c0_g1~~TRINITY_DN27247_c0_g1_i1.p1  ORF type:complete len:292 (-),score=65.93 TRINITY_DN27247_c0_g1_i1:111-950(-)